MSSGKKSIAYLLSALTCGGAARFGCTAAVSNSAKVATTTGVGLLHTSDDLLRLSSGLYDDVLRANPGLYDDVLRANPGLYDDVLRANPGLYDDVLRANPGLYDDVLRANPGLYDDVLRANPGLYDDVLRANPRLATVPRPVFLSQSGEVAGSNTAKSVVTTSSIEVKVLDSSGNAIATLSNAQQTIIKTQIQTAFKQKFVNIVDEVFASVEAGKITTAKQLNAEIARAINQSLGRNPNFAFDLASGNLKYNFQFYGLTSQGSINVIKAVKDGLIIGAAGHYVVKQIK